MALYFNTPANYALNMAVSTVKDRFNGTEFENWKKFKEAEQKQFTSTIERLNQIIVGLNYVCKTVNGSAGVICKTIGNSLRF